MGVMKRIATALATNPGLVGGRDDPEIAAMRRLYLECVERNLPEPEPPRVVREARDDYQGLLPF